MGARLAYPRDLRVRDVLQVLRQAAAKGLRCPTNEEIEQQTGAMHFSETPPQLALAGLLTVEIYGKNYRVIEIDGIRTAAAPEGRKPYRVYGKSDALGR